MKVGLLLVVCSATYCFGQSSDVRQTLSAIHNKCGAAKEFSLAAEMLVEVQRGTDPGRILARAKVVYAAGPEGRFRLEVDGDDHDPYVLVSDTQKNWAYVPKLKQYTETEGATVSEQDDEDGSDEERDLAAVFTQGLPEVFAI